MKFRKLIWSLAATSLVFAGCHRDGSDAKHHTSASEGLEYAPQMYDSYPYEPYKQVDYNPNNMALTGGTNVRPSVEGAIAMGKLGYELPYGSAPINQHDLAAWNEGYARAATEIKMPDSLTNSEEQLKAGETLFVTYCDHCHGTQGQGDGPISKAEKIIVPSYTGAALMALTPGQMFYSITYGKNAMGSHASQVNPHERWLLVQYVRKLQGRTDMGTAPAAEPASGTTTAGNASAATAH